MIQEPCGYVVAGESGTILVPVGLLAGLRILAVVDVDDWEL